MASRRLLIVQGLRMARPIISATRWPGATATLLLPGATKSARSTSRKLDFPVLRSRQEWESESLPPGLAGSAASDHLGRASSDHLPPLARRHARASQGLLGAGGPAGLRRRSSSDGRPGRKLLGGRSARIVVTMGMPAFVYRWYFGAHSVKSLERNILRFAGIAPVCRSLVGMVEGRSAAPSALAAANCRARPTGNLGVHTLSSLDRETVLSRPLPEGGGTVRRPSRS